MGWDETDPKPKEVSLQQELEQTCFFTAVDPMDISILAYRFEQRSTTDGASQRDGRDRPMQFIGSI